jgi:SAM-dependent methyltransferase
MTDAKSIAGHWSRKGLYELIVSTLRKTSKGLEGLSVEDLAPVDHYHARGLPATVELADRMPIRSGHRLVDIGSGLGGPARYIAGRFGCHVSGIDITPSFVETANRLTALLRMEGQVTFELGDGQKLPFPDASFDGGYSQHVTMNVKDRRAFFGEAWRVLKPGAFFALTEHGLGPKGDPLFPVPWSEDGSGSYLIPPSETRTIMESAGFEAFEVEEPGAKYAAGYSKAIEQAEKGLLPPLGLHLLLGENALEKTRNSARNIQEGRTQPFQVICRKPQ